MEKAEAIIFDLDGTMWDATEGILKTWNEIISAHPECRRGLLTLEELGGYLGLPMTAIASKMLPHNTEEERNQLIEECCGRENGYLAEHGGRLYPKLEETLRTLRKDYKLFIVSNCQSGYIESFLQAHKLAGCFDDKQCWGDNRVSKGENNRLIMERNHVTRAVYVGDTSGDEQSARDAGIPFIYAAYGFGRAEAPDAVLRTFEELPDIMSTRLLFLK